MPAAAPRVPPLNPSPRTIRMAETTRTTVFDFFREVSEQLRKVTWPDWAQLRESTGVIAVFVLTVALIIYGMDYGVRIVIELLTSLFTG